MLRQQPTTETTEKQSLPGSSSDRFYQDAELQARLDETLANGGTLSEPPSDERLQQQGKIAESTGDTANVAEHAPRHNGESAAAAVLAEENDRPDQSTGKLLHPTPAELTQLALAKQNKELRDLRNQVSDQAIKLDQLELHSTSYWLTQTNSEIKRLGKAIVQRSAEIEKLEKIYHVKVKSAAAQSKTDKNAMARSLKECNELKLKISSHGKELERDRLSMREQTEVHRILKLPQSTHVATLIGLVRQTENLRKGNLQLTEQVRLLKLRCDQMQSRLGADGQPIVEPNIGRDSLTAAKSRSLFSGR